MPLSSIQKEDIVIIERVASVFSLVGAAFVIATFLLSDKFRKPINRLVFLATFGNILVNIATLISTDGIEAGQGASLCQFQAFLIQWFMPADALWTFAMSCNVWLSFFKSYDASRLRRLEWKYLLICYGVPFVPALCYLFIRTSERGRVYGFATLWCWVSLEWDFLRVATFYGPVWIVILATIGIYMRVGAIIFKWRKQLLSMGRDHTIPGTNEYPATGILKTQEVIVTRTEDAMTGGRPDSGQIQQKGPSLTATSRRRTGAAAAAGRPSGVVDPNKAALKYCKCAMLFFIALIITWVPSTINRIYTIVRPDEVVFGLNLAAAVVLPLQGFWNAVIYMATSSFAVKCLFQDIFDVCRPKRRSMSTQGTQRYLFPTNELEDRASKAGSHDLRYDLERSSSQSELVGQAK